MHIRLCILSMAQYTRSVFCIHGFVVSVYFCHANCCAAFKCVCALCMCVCALTPSLPFAICSCYCFTSAVSLLFVLICAKAIVIVIATISCVLSSIFLIVSSVGRSMLFSLFTIEFFHFRWNRNQIQIQIFEFPSNEFHMHSFLNNKPNEKHWPDPEYGLKMILYKNIAQPL